jgi:hypothetical protein
MQLSNASVESFADGALTLAFAQAGVAKGFMTGGYDKDLTQVLDSMFGMTPVIRTAVREAGSSGQSAAPASAPSRAEPRPPAADAGGQGQPSARARAEQSARDRSQRPDPVPAASAEADPEPSDPPAPDVLTGTDLIERELGGRVIQELDES